MRYTLLLIGLLTVPLVCFGQFGVGAEHLLPTGKAGRIYKQGMGVSLEYSPTNTIRSWNVTLVGRAFRVTAHQDTLRSTYGFDLNNGNFSPGYGIYKPAYYLDLALRGHWRLRVNEPFSPIALISIGGFYKMQETEHFIPGVVSETALSGDQGISGSLGVGAEYEFNRNLALRFVFAHHALIGFQQQEGLFRYWRTNLTGIYYW